MMFFIKVVSSLPSNLGYTAWTGLSVNTANTGQIRYTWRRSNELVSYTHWDKGQPSRLPILQNYNAVVVVFTNISCKEINETYLFNSLFESFFKIKYLQNNKKNNRIIKTSVIHLLSTGT